MEYNIYRLVGDKRPISWQLPLKEVFVKKFVEDNGKKVDQGYRRIKYVPGTNTMFAEDIKGDLQAETIWFYYGELKVIKDDKLKNDILKAHGWYGKKYVLWSQEMEDTNNLEALRFKATSRQLIDDAGSEKIKAIALAVYGYPAMAWDANKCELELRKYADTKPKKLQEVMKEEDYESRYLSGLAFSNNIVKENEGKTAVIWTDGEGVIVKLAKGEKGINELGRFLSKVTDESREVLQSIGDRLDKEVSEPADGKSEKEIALEAEITALKKQLSANNDGEDLNIVDAHKAYKKKYNKDVPKNMKNNLSWIKTRLSSES